MKNKQNPQLAKACEVPALGQGWEAFNKTCPGGGVGWAKEGKGEKTGTTVI